MTEMPEGWMEQLTNAARYVISRQFYKNGTNWQVDELINAAWIRSTRRLRPDSTMKGVFCTAVNAMKEYIGGRKGSRDEFNKKYRREHVKLLSIVGATEDDEGTRCFEAEPPRVTYEDADEVVGVIMTKPPRAQSMIVDRLNGYGLQEIAERHGVKQLIVWRVLNKHFPQWQKIKRR